MLDVSLKYCKYFGIFKNFSWFGGVCGSVYSYESEKNSKFDTNARRNTAAVTQKKRTLGICAKLAEYS